MAYIGRTPSGLRTRYLFTATEGQTSFTTSDSSGNLSYTDATLMDVYLNGVLLDPVNDYAATTGSSVVLTEGTAAGDIMECVVYDGLSGSSGGGITTGKAIAMAMVFG